MSSYFPRLASSSLKKGLNAFLILIICLTIVIWSPVKASAGSYMTTGVNFSVISNLMNYGLLFFCFESDDDFLYCASDRGGSYYNANVRYLFLPNVYDYSYQYCKCSNPSVIDNLNYRAVHPTAAELTSYIDYYTDGSKLDTKFVTLKLTYIVENMNANYKPLHNLEFGHFIGYKNMGANVNGYYSCPVTSQYRNGSQTVGTNLSFNGAPYPNTGNWLMTSSCSNTSDVQVHYSDPNQNDVQCVVEIPLSELSIFNVQVSDITFSGSGFNYQVNLEQSDPCGGNNVCDCNCGYYSEQLQENLEEYFETNMVTREMFEEYVENNTVINNYYESQQSEIASIQSETSFEADIETYKDDQNALFSDINGYMSDLDEFESGLTISPEVSAAAGVINGMFENIPSSVIVAMVFCLVVLVLVKIIGR